MQDRHQTIRMQCDTGFSISDDAISEVTSSPQCSMWETSQEDCIISCLRWVLRWQKLCPFKIRVMEELYSDDTDGQIL